MPGRAYQNLLAFAVGQNGYLTTTQAAAAGVERHALIMMARRGELEPVSHGVYRLTAVPPGAFDQYIAATLWPYGTEGVLSHDTALAIYELSDINPAKIHLTVPRTYRIRRRIPGVYIIHHADLTAKQKRVWEGLPITTPAQTIRDCHARHLGPALIQQAIEDGRRTGVLSGRDADTLERELLASSSTQVA